MAFQHFLSRLAGRRARDGLRILRMESTYRFVRLLGEGGMGQVWLAEKLGASGFSKLSAVKTIRKERVADERVLEMFMDEARLVANLVHPNIVQVHHLFRTRKEIFIVMEHVFGVTLLKLLERLQRLGRSMSPEMGAYIVSRTCHGLHYAHMKTNRDGRHLGIVHRDICPSNILISFRGIPKLADFGVAKAVSSTVDDEGNVVWGKYPYMAPEAVRRQGTDPRSDIYSMGLLLFEMFTGILAHQADSTRKLEAILQSEAPERLDVRRHRERFPDPHSGVSWLPDSGAVVTAAARHDTWDRDLATDLEQFLLSHFLLPDEESLSDYLASVLGEAKKHRWW